MKVIDFNQKGNVIKLYFGNDKDKKYWGDDWDDKPYEHNAGEVYDRFVVGYTEYAFPTNYDIMQPASDWHYGGNSPFSKEDMKKRRCPCLIISIQKEDLYFSYDYSELLGSEEDDVLKIYFNDKFDDIDKKIKEFGGICLKGE